MASLLVRAARGERTERPPVWLMRQAGRHLPEYRELREAYAFRELVRTPALAVEVSVQPWERYRPDGVVVFSDILTALEPLGMEYRIEPGVGPVIPDPITDPQGIPAKVRDVGEVLGYVGAAIEALVDRVGEEAAVIGFAGGPYTLASYAIGGGAGSRFAARRFFAEHPEGFQELLGVFTEVVIEHLAFQAAAGADVVQVFDTYAGELPPAAYREVVLPCHREIFDSLEVPGIVFVRGMGGRLDQLSGSGADVVGLDWTVAMDAARAELGGRAVQGNLDPAVLFADPKIVREHTRAVLEAAGPAGHILNLGHGVHKDTPVRGVRAFVETAKEFDR